MKKIFKNITASLLLIMATFSLNSCEKTYFEGVNDDPNSPTDVPPSVLLPSIQAEIAWAQGGDMARFTSLLIQQVRGASRQFTVYETYNFTEDDFDNLWRLNLYAGPLMDLYTLNKICKDKGYIHYGAVGNIMMAYGLMITTDCFGNAPYSQAFQGTQNISPAYDSQESLYADMNTLLDEAIAALDAPDGSGVEVGSEDFVYGGDYTLWKKFAWSLKARLAIHKTKVPGSNAAADAITAINNGGFTSNSDDAQFNFYPGPTTDSPWFQYIEQRDDIAYTDSAGTLVTLTDQIMPSMNDPRRSIYLSGTTLGDFYGGETAPVFFMTYFEMKFIEAEAKERTGDDAGAQTALNDAVTAQMTKVGVSAADITTFLAANCVLTGTQQDKIDQIMTQKYIAMYLQPEAWTDWRRTNIPALTSNLSGSQIPRRFIYPQSETDNNKASRDAAVAAMGCGSNSLDCRVWWDQ
ncbi:MAG: SusD/RagB family nutrient-binding outer membrane lipoprotein [Bacteroidia bacterium]|nr:SusD/RagB family nutrient-binding outer membrane lipoprotein [Bacteroidia bacterium]